MTFKLNVSCNIGTKGKTDEIKLDNWGNDFERGDIDEYSVEAMDVGQVLMIHLHNDGGGWWYKNPDWFVNKISVISSSQEDPFEFPCHRWVSSDLAVFEGKGITKFWDFLTHLLKCSQRTRNKRVGGHVEDT